MKKKGFTLVELLVVIAIIALLMSILMPTLAKVRAMAQRAVCSTNLSSLHKSFMTYAQDNHDDYPRAGGKLSKWSATPELSVFYEKTALLAYQGGNPNQDGVATMGASLYYLIKYADAAPKEYLCGGDSSAVEFELSLYRDIIPDNTELAETQDITLAWDFGGKEGGVPGNSAEGGDPPAQHYSYSYQIPYGDVEQQYYSLSTTRQPEIPVMADRNPYLLLIREDDRPLYEYGDSITEKWGNSPNHKYEGQNVLFNDSSTKWHTVPYCGINQDNIYSIQTNSDYPQIGEAPRFSYDPQALSQNGFDSLLLNEGFPQPGIGP